jgi:hypothetical protein
MASAPLEVTRVGPGSFLITIPETSITVRLEGLRMTAQGLQAEVQVWLPDADPGYGTSQVPLFDRLAVGSLRARKTLAREISARTGVELEWPAVLDEIASRVRAALAEGTGDTGRRPSPWMSRSLNTTRLCALSTAARQETERARSAHAPGRRP